jgi:hypothetical protein
MIANAARVALVLGAAIALIGSAESNRSNQQASTMQTGAYGQAGGSPPPAQDMEASRALGLWNSSFGAVKIEPDARGGGIEAGAVQGAWVYKRRGEEVIGIFWGNLRGNVLEFRFQEPGNPPLTGAGYLVFDRSGRQYQGRWWTDRRDRVGDWTGRRDDMGRRAPRNPNPDPYADPNDAYGGRGYGDRDAPQQQPPPRQPQPSTYGPQPPPPNYY